MQKDTIELAKDITKYLQKHVSHDFDTSHLAQVLALVTSAYLESSSKVSDFDVETATTQVVEIYNELMLVQLTFEGEDMLCH